MTGTTLSPSLHFRNYQVDVAAGDTTELQVTGSFIRISDANRDFELSFDGSRSFSVHAGNWFSMPVDPLSGFGQTFERLFITAPAGGSLSATIQSGFGQVGDDSAILNVTGTVPVRMEEIASGLVAAGNHLPVDIAAQSTGNVDINVAASALPLRVERNSVAVGTLKVCAAASVLSVAAAEANRRSLLVANVGGHPAYLSSRVDNDRGFLLEAGERIELPWAFEVFCENKAAVGNVYLMVFSASEA